MFALFSEEAAGEDGAAAGAEPLGPGAERSPERPPEADPGGEQLAGQDVQRLPLSEPRSFTFEEAGDFGITPGVSSEGKVVFVEAVEGAALEQGVPPMSIILALNGSDVSELARVTVRAMLKVRPLTLTVRPPADQRAEQQQGRHLLRAAEAPSGCLDGA